MMRSVRSRTSLGRCVAGVAAGGRRGVRAAGARSQQAARDRPGAVAEAAGDPEAEALERPARLDRRAPRSAARAGQPDRALGQRRRSDRQVRRRQPHGRDARRRRRHAQRRSSSPTRSSSSARNLSTTSSFDSSAVRMSVPVAKLAEALPLMADVDAAPDVPGRASSIGCARSGSPACCRRATTRRR